MDNNELNADYLKVKNKEYNIHIHDPWIWEEQAGILKRAADCLLDKYNASSKKLFSRIGGAYLEEREDIYDLNLLGVYYMLIGLSVENLTKKIVLMKNPELEKNLAVIKSHEMRKLMQDYNIKGFENYYGLLDNLRTYVIWKGRYTFPFDFSEITQLSYHPEMPKDEIDSLYQELNKKFEQYAKIQQLRDNIRLDISRKDFLDVKKEVIRFIEPKGRHLCVRDITKAIKTVDEISEKIGYKKALVMMILFELLDEEITMQSE